MAYDQTKADIICQRLTAGESLRSVCRDPDLPAASTVLLWVDTNAAFAEQYVRARRLGYALLAEELVEIADEVEFEPVPGPPGEEPRAVRVDATAVARNRLRVDTRKWMLSKMLPKVFGDKIDHTHTGTVNVSLTSTEADL